MPAPTTPTRPRHRRTQSQAQSQAHPGHTIKSKSISSLPPHRAVAIHRLTPSTILGAHPDASVNVAGPSTYTSTLSRSSSLRSRCKASPSRLPATDAVSYFPPFEDMGSSPACPITSPLARSERAFRPDSWSPASRSQHPRPHPHTHPGLLDNSRGHAKGRSLGSIAGFMSASLRGLSSMACGSPPLSPGENDGQALQALTERVAPSGKRRVLEPFSIAGAAEGELRVPELAPGPGPRPAGHKRRMKSELEVELVVAGLGRSSSLGGKSTIRSRRQQRVDDEDVVEGMVVVDGTPSRATRKPRTRPNLKLPIPTFPSWRFPTLGPSSPVTCLSPDIPLEAFMIIDNPCSAGAGALRPTLGITRDRDRDRDRDRATECRSPAEEELDMIDSHLSPTPSPTSAFSQPSTPPKSDYYPDIKRHPHHDADTDTDTDQEGLQRWSTDIDSKGAEVGHGSKLGLERTCSRVSEMSCETIKWEDVTPKAVRVRTVV